MQFVAALINSNLANVLRFPSLPHLIPFLFAAALPFPGGIYSNSLAIATDAAHLMADLASFMISLFALWIAARPSTKR